MSGAWQTLHAALHWGSETQSDPTLRRKILLTNIGALVAALSLLFYLVVTMPVLARPVVVRMVLSEIPIAALLALIPWLNRQGRINAARWLLAGCAIGSQLLVIWLDFGTYLNTHFYFVVFALLPVVFFPLSNWRSIVFLFILNMGLFLYFERTWCPPSADVLALPVQNVTHLRGSYTVTAFATVLLFMLLQDGLAMRSERRLDRMSVTDALTGLPNRRFFELAFEQEQAKSRRDGTPLALALIDLDHFKQINDRYGHKAGDALLQHVAQTLRQNTRAGNVVARVGGEEFAVLLPNTAMADAAEVAERMRVAMANNRCEYDGKALEITLSIGVAPVDPVAHRDLSYRLADDALYAAKQAGRNRVFLHAGKGLSAQDFNGHALFVK